MAASLPNLEIQTKSRISSSITENISEYDESSEQGYDIEILFRIMLIITGVMVSITILALFTTRKGRGTLVLFLILFFIWTFFVPTLKVQFPRFGLNLQSGKEYQDNDLMLLEERISEPPLWLVLSFSLGFSTLLTGGAYFLWRRFRKRSSPIEMVFKETQKAIDNLRSGFELGEGVIRYYHEMSKAINKYRGLKRKTGMTTREFENYLEVIGLPSTPIKRLTRLFEKVRYGAKDLDQSENKEAVACLTAILKACREVK